MNSFRARAVLGLQRLPCTEATVRSAYALHLKAIHPDKTVDAVADVAERIADLQAAKSILLLGLESTDSPAARSPRPRTPPWQGGSIAVPFFAQMHPPCRPVPGPVLPARGAQRQCCFPGCLIAVSVGTFMGSVCCPEHTDLRYANVPGFVRPLIGPNPCLFCPEPSLFDDRVCKRHLAQVRNTPINRMACLHRGCLLRAMHRKTTFCYKHSRLAL